MNYPEHAVRILREYSAVETSFDQKAHELGALAIEAMEAQEECRKIVAREGGGSTWKPEHRAIRERLDNTLAAYRLAAGHGEEGRPQRGADATGARISGGTIRLQDKDGKET